MKKKSKKITKTNAHQINAIKKTSSVAKKPTYIYTEEDLGEGLLDIGGTS